MNIDVKLCIQYYEIILHLSCFQAVQRQLSLICPTISLYTVILMVIKHANPPSTLEIGYAKNTPTTPNPILGKNIVSGTTINAFRRSEKKIACFASPSA